MDGRFPSFYYCESTQVVGYNAEIVVFDNRSGVPYRRWKKAVGGKIARTQTPNP